MRRCAAYARCICPTPASLARHLLLLLRLLLTLNGDCVLVDVRVEASLHRHAHVAADLRAPFGRRAQDHGSA